MTGLAQFDYSNPTGGIKDFQNWMISKGAKLPRYGADGSWGKESQTALNQMMYRPEAFNQSAYVQPASGLSTVRTGQRTAGVEGGNWGVNTPDFVPTTTGLAGGLGTYGMYNGIGVDKAAYDAIKGSGVTDGLYVNPENVSGFSLDSLGGMKGLADIAGGIASLGGLYTGLQQNRMAQEALDMKRDEYNRQVRRDKDFATNIAKSSLGTYSAG